MQKSVFEGSWKEIRAKSQEWWSLINDIDLARLDESPDKFKKYVMLLQVKYGYTSEFAAEEINRRIEAQGFEANEVPAREPGKTRSASSKRKTGNS